ncbi:hypothetical protein [Holdemania sp. 1001302B_160321_E10]|uniref:hypothetical protein n=1 Tax=Holdemania sp. 1001302B_160321_E10 TaxID=2787120 RepID=UPI00189940A2|nr:hypothetical protein [Holdemania sp. 1001302B_160321_E10]
MDIDVEKLNRVLQNLLDGNDLDDNRITKYSEKEEAMNDVLAILDVSSDEFDPSSFVSRLKSYIENHDRILYSVVTNRVYAKKTVEMGTLLTNLDKVLQSEYIFCNFDEEKRANIIKVIIKLTDHINLAMSQKTSFEMSDEAFKKRSDPLIKAAIKATEERFEGVAKKAEAEVGEVKKDILNQLISIVAIFTAISFVMFGGISTMSTLFKEIGDGVDLGKVMVLGSMLGMAMVAATYLFLRFVMVIVKDSAKHPVMDKIFYCSIALLFLMFIISLVVCYEGYDLMPVVLCAIVVFMFLPYVIDRIN